MGNANDLNTEPSANLQARATAIEASMDGIAILAADETYDYVNSAHAEVYGYDEPSAFEGESWTMRYGTDEVARFENEVMPTLYEECEWRGRATGVKQDGTEFPQELSLSLSPNDRVVCVVRDVTEQAETRKALEERTERLEQFSRLITHDLRNPLSVAQGRARLLEESDLDDAQREDLKALSRSLDRIDELIEDALRYAESTGRPDPEALKSVNPARIANQAWQNVATREASIEIEEMQSVAAEPTRLQQVFENLFRNAVEHAGEAPDVRVAPLDDRTGFAVADDGPGIDPEDRDSIFDVGFTTKQGGTGYGLGTVSQFVEGHGWNIYVTESRQGGARFEVVVDDR